MQQRPLLETSSRWGVILSGSILGVLYLVIRFINENQKSFSSKIHPVTVGIKRIACCLCYELLMSYSYTTTNIFGNEEEEEKGIKLLNLVCSLAASVQRFSISNFFI